jgi:GT2 family glycosyltransferase
MKHPMIPLAPIALFVYNRPWHTRQTVEALKKNQLFDSSDLIILSDGAKDQASAQKVEEVRQYLRTISGFKSVKIIERDCNIGLAQSIISGVTQVINEYGRVIVMEDDLVTSPFFLRYMNDALECYENEDKVISIHGYCYPISVLPETFFLKGNMAARVEYV